MLFSQTHAIFVLLVFYILEQTQTEAYTDEKVELKSRIDKKNACLQDCKRHINTSSSEDEDDSDCLINCTVQRRKKDTTALIVGRASYGCSSNKVHRTTHIGQITNVSATFEPVHLNGSIVSWTANVTWQVTFNNSNMSTSDIWTGFNILYWRSSFTRIKCYYNSKNTTWRTIETGIKPMVEVSVVFYPPSDEDMRKKMKHLYPPGYTFKPNAKTTEPATATTNVTATDLPKYTDMPQNNSYIPVAIVAGVLLALISLVILIILHIKRKKSTSLPPSPDPREFSHDTSIIFSSSDQAFVTEILIPFLEKENNFKCFVHYRDWEVGEELHTNIAHTIYRCRKIIAVISKHFLESNYCQEELSMALERQIRCNDSSLLVINLGVSPELLPEALRTRTFLDLTSKEETKTWKARMVRQISTEESRTQSSTTNSTNAPSGQKSGKSKQTFRVKKEQGKFGEEKDDVFVMNNLFTESPSVEIQLNGIPTHERLSTESEQGDYQSLFIENNFAYGREIPQMLNSQLKKTKSSDDDSSSSSCTKPNSDSTDDCSQSSTSNRSIENACNSSVHSTKISIMNTNGSDDENWIERFKKDLESRSHLDIVNKLSDVEELEQDGVNNNQDRIVTATLKRADYSQSIDSDTVTNVDSCVGIPV